MHLLPLWGYHGLPVGLEEADDLGGPADRARTPVPAAPGCSCEGLQQVPPPFTVLRGGGQMRSVNCCYLYLSARGPVARIAVQRLLSRAEGTEWKGAAVNAPRLELRRSPPAPQHVAVISARERDAQSPLLAFKFTFAHSSYLQFSIDTLTQWSLSKCFWKVYERWLLLEVYKFVFTLWDVILVSSSSYLQYVFPHLIACVKQMEFFIICFGLWLNFLVYLSLERTWVRGQEQLIHLDVLCCVWSCLSIKGRADQGALVRNQRLPW